MRFSRLVKSLILFFLVLASRSMAVLPIDPMEVIAKKPELEKALADFEAQMQALDAEIDLPVKAALSSYTQAIEALNIKYSQMPEGTHWSQMNKLLSVGLSSLFSHKMLVERRGINIQFEPNASAEVTALWSKVLRAQQIAKQAVAPRKSALILNLNKTLVALDNSFLTQRDVIGREIIVRARASLSIRIAVEAERLDTTRLNSKFSREVWRDVATDGGYLVGFEWAKGEQRGRKDAQGQPILTEVVSLLKPIFATPRTVRDGGSRGSGQGAREVAKDGYAVSGISVQGEPVKAFKITFMQLKPDGISLDPAHTYTSEWLGNSGTGDVVEFRSKGKVAVGIIGGSTYNVDSIGMIYLK